jgi:colicin import membrane protein
VTETHEDLYNPLGWSFALHIVIVVAMTITWIWHENQEVVTPPAMMKASLVHAPKSTIKPQQKTQTQKPEPAKPEPPKPEPPKPEVAKPTEVKPDVVPTDKPSPIAAKKEPPKPVTPPDTKKPDPKKVEPPKPDAKKADKKQDAKSQVDKEKQRKDAEAALAAAMEVEENILQEGSINDDEIGKYIGLIANRIADNWSRPPNARKDMKVLLEIELLPTGQLVNVRIVESSGDRAFDLAAETAVRKVERFEEIATMKPALFNSTFRKFNLLFNPEDLLL